MLRRRRELNVQSRPEGPDTSGLPGNFVLVLVLFIFARLMATLLLLPGGYLFRGQLDHGFYASFAELSALGYFPYLHYWLEYPPLFGWTLVGAYQLATLLPRLSDHFFWFHTLVSLVLLLAEIGNLVLIYRIGRLMHDNSTALRCAWIYATLFVPVYVMLGTFESFPLFFLLLALYLVLCRRPWAGGIATGIGFQVKLLPLLVAPVAWHALSSNRYRLSYLLATSASIAAIGLPLWLANHTMLLASFHAMLSRSSWATVWALLEGYYSFGKVAPLADRFVAETAGWQAHAATLPWLWIEAGFLLLYLLVWTRRFDGKAPAKLVALAGLTVTVALLASKGYSTQFLVYQLPFIVLLLPNTLGAAYAILLSTLDFAEGVLFFTLFPDQHWMLVVTVVGRTGIWVALSLEYLVVFLPRLGQARERAVSACRASAIVLAVVFALATVVPPLVLLSHSERFAAAGEIIRREGSTAQAIVLADRDSFVDARRYLPTADIWFPTARTDASLDRVEADLAAFLRGRALVWFIADRHREESLVSASLRYLLDWQATPQSVRWFDGLELRGYRFPGTGDPSLRTGRRLSADFGTIDLLGYDLVPAEPAVGEHFRLILYWRASAPALADYDAFVHLINAAYRSFGTGDRPLSDEQGRPPTQWIAGQIVRQAHDLKAPLGTPPGEYLLEIGLYNASDGKRLPVLAQGTNAGSSDRVMIPGLRLGRGRPLLATPIQNRADANFGGLIALAGYDVGERRAAGQELGVTLYWRPLRRIPNDYTVFVHLLDANGRIQAQHDGAPADSSYPTTRWESGELVRDHHVLVLPKALPACAYRIRVGLYLAGSGQRLAVQDGDRQTVTDAVDLGQAPIEVQ